MTKSKMAMRKERIAETLEQAETPLLRRDDLRIVLDSNRDDWELPSSVTLTLYLRFLENEEIVEKIELGFPSRQVTLYAVRKFSKYDLALAAAPRAYFSHITAMYIHSLTEDESSTVYINQEQRPKAKSKQKLSQGRIDAALSNNPRISTNIAEYEGMSICLLNGMNTARLGVVSHQAEPGVTYAVTGPERTLIDIAVRPFYSGGSSVVVEAYRRAAPSITVQDLKSILAEIDYTYPYHQAVGFYLERSGAYQESDLSLIESFGIKHRFYLEYAMSDPSYSERWQIYFPKEI